jgi:hypothetical protein
MNPRPNADSMNSTLSLPLVCRVDAAATVAPDSTRWPAGNRSSASTAPIRAA